MGLDVALATYFFSQAEYFMGNIIRDVESLLNQIV
jgi:hypothetical protein